MAGLGIYLIISAIFGYVILKLQYQDEEPTGDLVLIANLLIDMVIWPFIITLIALAWIMHMIFEQ